MATIKTLIDEYQACLNHIGGERNWLDEASLMNDLTYLLMIAQRIYSDAILAKDPECIHGAGSVLQQTVTIIMSMGDILAKGSEDIVLVRSELAPVFAAMQLGGVQN